MCCNINAYNEVCKLHVIHSLTHTHTFKHLHRGIEPTNITSDNAFMVEFVIVINIKQIIVNASAYETHKTVNQNDENE